MSDSSPQRPRTRASTTGDRSPVVGENNGLIVGGDLNIAPPVGRPSDNRKPVLLALAVSSALAVAVFLVVLHVVPDGGTSEGGETPQQVAESSSSPPSSHATEKSGEAEPDGKSYTLKESNNPLTSGNDKLDIDTGLPGRGSQPQLRQNPGGLADVILEPERFHTPDEEPRLLMMPRSAAGPEDCQAAMSERSADMRGSIPNDELVEGAKLCVRTDLGATALIDVQEFTPGYPATLTMVVRTPAA